MRIWDQWVTEGHTEWHAGSSRPPTIKAREDRQIGKLALQNRTTTTRTISQEMSMFAIRPVFAQRNGNSDASNDKAGYKSGRMSSFQMSPSSACSILMSRIRAWRLQEVH
ncbi:hypothetical protein TNCV_500061 [Trichonephila clavipes]|nr:hypothetical protein TNCV_500061 [Trichonephila clavipes]